ncbi:unnamed protein product [Rotaria sp. Silwood2]|nr:unnamed protein product [Rotaria sp. Silwood2]CAF2618965.1 unnamed protein product [Rotaria sp. Silwood2]CAF4326769.1 unnamed protein product [Rotaria sp. Silwood2]CAF4369387.1 unnamed protein product [Rotaria sp. Silwood2]
MSDLVSQADVHLPPDSPDVCILSPVPVLSSTSDNSTETTSQTIVNIPKTVRDKFYVNIKTYETNWSGQCILCNKIKYDNKGVTSNINRHVKSQHGKEYQEWLAQLNESSKKDQTKITDIFIKTNETTRTSSFSKAHYKNNHPRQIQLSQSIVENLIIDIFTKWFYISTTQGQDVKKDFANVNHVKM